MSDTRELAERIFLVLIASETAGTFEHEASLALEAAERFNAVADRKFGDPRTKLPSRPYTVGGATALNYREPENRWTHCPECHQSFLGLIPDQKHMDACPGILVSGAWKP